MCFGGPEEKLNDTEFAQSAILLTSLAISSVLADRVNIDYVAGLSLGEYSALTFANSFSLEDAVEIARNLLRDYEYGYSIDDLVVEAEGFMESCSFEIDKKI